MPLRVALAQIDPVVGDIDGNIERILSAWRDAAAAGCDLVVFSELAVTGYPPEDLLLRPEFVAANTRALDRLAADAPAGTVGVVGFVGDGARSTDADHWDQTVSARDLHNAAAVIGDGRVVATYSKWRLPNYGVFDEARYFQADDETVVVSIRGVAVGVVVCEDLWVEQGPATDAARAGARVIAHLNASPYHQGKRDQRERWARHHATQDGTFVCYTNCVGGQDEVVFDGDSMIVGPDGSVLARGAQFREDLVLLDLDVDPAEVSGVPTLPGYGDDRQPLPQHEASPRLQPVAEVWAALVLGTRDYVHKNGFDRVWLGLSGGIDSAVTAAVAADAVGPEHVTGIALPSPYSSEHSLRDARALAENLGIEYREIPIAPAMEAFDEMLAEAFAGTEPGVAEENIQARIRGAIWMAMSNKHGGLVLTTGNKSELAVGYATLYGDMAGGFAVLKDVPKTLVYQLAEHRNTLGPAIPRNSIDKPPSAELKPGQYDADTLPTYDILDAIIEAYVEDDLGRDEIIRRGHDAETVSYVLRLIDGAEYKRRQAAPGIKITDRAFGKDRRLPITNHWTG